MDLLLSSDQSKLTCRVLPLSDKRCIVYMPSVIIQLLNSTYSFLLWISNTISYNLQCWGLWLPSPTKTLSHAMKLTKLHSLNVLLLLNWQERSGGRPIFLWMRRKIPLFIVCQNVILAFMSYTCSFTYPIVIFTNITMISCLKCFNLLLFVSFF